MQFFCPGCGTDLSQPMSDLIQGEIQIKESPAANAEHPKPNLEHRTLSLARPHPERLPEKAEQQSTNAPPINADAQTTGTKWKPLRLIGELLVVGVALGVGILAWKLGMFMNFIFVLLLLLAPVNVVRFAWRA